MTTYKQNQEFATALLSDSALDAAIEWITSHLTPGEVFGEDELREYVAENNRVDEVFSEDSILKFVEETYQPESVFTADELSNWARSSGFEEIL